MKQEVEEILKNLKNVKNKAIEDLKKEKRNEDSVIQNVKYYGKVALTRKDGQEEKINLYTVEEYDSQIDKVNTSIYINGQKKDMKELMKEYEDFESIRDVLNKERENKEENLDNEKVPKNKIYNLNELEAEKDMEEYAKVAGINKKDVKKVTEIKNKEADKKKLETVNHLQEIKGDTKVNNHETISQAIGLTGVNKFVMVYSEDTQIIAKNNDKESENNNSKYSIIAVMDDGNVINIDDKLELNRAAGINGSNNRIQTNADGTTREESKQASIYDIKGKDKSILIERDNFGEMQVYYGSKTKGSGENEGNQFVGTQLETNNIWPTSTKVRSQEDQNKGEYHVEEKAEEANKHLEGHGENTIENIENADGNENTNEPCEEEIKECIFKIMENETIELNYSEEEVREYLIEVIKNNPKMNAEEVSQYVEVDLERNAPIKAKTL